MVRTREEGTNGQRAGLVPLLLLVMVILQAATLFFLMNPKAQPVYESLSPEAAKQQEENTALLQEMSAVVTLPTNASPVIAEVMDVDLLKNEHPVNAQVYADAQNGDKVIAYEDRLIIYRSADKKVIYDGKNPTQLAQEQYLAELQAVLSKVSALTEISQEVVPQLSTIGDVDKLKASDPNVFANAANGDSILVYEDRIIIYRASSNKIILDAGIKDGKVVMPSNNDEDEE